MTTSFLPAFLLVSVGGVRMGLFTAPMNYLTRWRGGNVWLVYALLMMSPHALHSKEVDGWRIHRAPCHVCDVKCGGGSTA